MRITNLIDKIKNVSFDTYINYLIIGYAFAIVTTKAGIVLIEHLLILSFLFKGDFKGIIDKLKNSRVIVVLFLFIILSLISVLWSSDKVFALLYIKKYYHFLCIPIIYLCFNPKYIQHVFTSFLAGMLFSEILSYAIFFELIQFNNVRPDNPTPFMNHIEYSIYLAFASMIILNRVFFTKNSNAQLFYFIYFLTTTSNLFINGGRTGQFIFIASLFILLFLNIKHKIKALSYAIILSVGLVTVAYNFSPVFKVRGTQAYYDITRTFINNDYSDSFGQRFSLWIMGVNVFSDNLLLGTGIGDEKEGMQKYANKYNISLYQNNPDKDQNYPDKGDIDYHSMYVQHAVQLGVFGLILMLYLVYSIYVIKFKSLIYRNLNIAFATAILISSTVGNILHSLFPMVFFAFFVGILSAISRHEANDNKER